MAYLTEPEPPYGIATDVITSVRRIVAPNPGIMTYYGTNTYLIDLGDGLAVLDPGPNNAQHVGAILSAVGSASVRLILITHTHHDHLGAAAFLKEATGAPIASFKRSADETFVPDIPIADGDEIGGMTAIHTPGHAADHLCYAFSHNVLFSGDHVMSWSSSVVSPPRGNMLRYCESLRRLLREDYKLLLPGHGPALPDPIGFVNDLLTHRLGREREILLMLRSGRNDIDDIVKELYAKRHADLMQAAQKNVLAHLLKLESEGLAVRDDDVWCAV